MSRQLFCVVLFEELREQFLVFQDTFDMKKTLMAGPQVWFKAQETCALPMPPDRPIQANWLIVSTRAEGELALAGGPH
jgi:hypothetical protein